MQPVDYKINNCTFEDHNVFSNVTFIIIIKSTDGNRFEEIFKSSEYPSGFKHFLPLTQT